jgi:uncharacterized membrane protein
MQNGFIEQQLSPLCSYQLCWLTIAILKASRLYQFAQGTILAHEELAPSILDFALCYIDYSEEHGI